MVATITKNVPATVKDEGAPTFILEFGSGINENQTPNIEEASAGANFELGARQTKLLPRAPFDLNGTAPNAGKITGIMQMITRAGVKTSLVVAGSVVYEWCGGTGSTMLGTTVNGQYTITVASTANLIAGQWVSGTGVGAAPNVITQINSPTQITVSVANTGSGTNTLTFSSYYSVGTGFVTDALFRSAYWPLNDTLIIADVSANNVVQTWNGTTLAAAPVGQTLTGTITRGSQVVTGLSSTTLLATGMVATGAVGAGIATIANTIASVDSGTQVTLSLNSVATTTGATIIFGVYTVTGNTTINSPVVTNISSTANLSVGMTASGTSLAPGNVVNVIQSIDSSSQVHLSVPSTQTGSVSISFGTGAPFYAKYAVVYLNRVWYFNITCGTSTPHMIVASYLNQPLTISINEMGGATTQGGGVFPTGLEAFFLLTPDMRPINGVAVFQNILVISTQDGMLFQLTGTDANTFQFTPFYVGSSAIDNESILNIGNDVIYMRKGGNINLLSSTQYFGDVRSNDISRWIPNTCAKQTTALIAYDQSKQKVYFFVPNMVLVLYKDILFQTAGQTDNAVTQGLSPWSYYTTYHANKFNTKAVNYIQNPQASNSTYTVYWGDSSGNIFDMNGVGANGDAGQYNINCWKQTRLFDCTVMNPFPYNEAVVLGKVQYQRQTAQTTLAINFEWSDEFVTSYAAVTLTGPAANTPYAAWGGSNYWGGGSYWNQGANAAPDTVDHQTFSVMGKGNGFYIFLQNISVNPWQIDHIELY